MCYRCICIMYYCELMLYVVFHYDFVVLLLYFCYVVVVRRRMLLYCIVMCIAEVISCTRVIDMSTYPNMNKYISKLITK